MSFMSKQQEYGYVSGIPDMSALRSTFSANSNPSLFTSLGADKPEPPRQIDVTDIAVDKTFHVELPKNLSVTSVQGPNVDSGVDLGKMRASVETVRQDYLDTDAMIKDVVIQGAHQVMDKEAGDHLMCQIIPKGGPTHLQAAATMADPSGACGGLWSALNSMQQARNATPPPVMLEQMAKILSCIQEASHNQAHGGLEEGQSQKPQLKIPEGLDFSGITPDELMGFMQRQVEDDPVMQETKKALDALDHFEKNEQQAEENDDQVVTVAKIEESIESGDAGRLAKLVGNDKAENVKAYSAFAVEFIGTGMKDMPQVVLSRNQPDPSEELKTVADIQRQLEELAAAAKMPLSDFNREAELQQVANYNSRPGMVA